MSKVVIPTLLLALLIPAWARADGEDLPADRTPLNLPQAPTGGGSTEAVPLPPSPDAGADLDAGRTDWSRPSEAEVRREKHMVLAGAAFGAAGAFAGIGASFLLVSIGQQDAGSRHGWEVAALVTGGISAAALATGTVLWLTTPSAPVQAAVVPAGAGLRLALRFP